MVYTGFMQSLHEKAVQIAREFRRAEAALIDVIQAVEDAKLYYEYQCRNLHEYVTRDMKLSDDVAATYIRLARKSREVPALKEKIQNHSVSITNARLIAPVLTEANQGIWLEKAEKLTKAKLERELAQEFPERAVREQVRYAAPERLELKLGISPELLEKLKRVQDLESQRTGKAETLEATLDAALESYLEKYDPLRKAARSRVRVAVPGRREPGKRVPIPASVVHAVQVRDQNRCTYIDPGTGERCPEKRWLELDHIQEVSKAGSNDVHNLRVMCSGHHRLRHHKKMMEIPVMESIRAQYVR